MSGPVGEGGQDVDLNLAPIIDCFTVLITYLLVTASFLTLSAVDVSVSASGTGAPPAVADNKPPPWAMSIELKNSYEMEILVKGGPKSEKFTYKIDQTAGTWNFEQLTARLRDIQKRWPSLGEASVTAHPTVIYKDIVNVLHEIQTTMPKVYISG
jgi:biopolymer transport protein ExbD